MLPKAEAGVSSSHFCSSLAPSQEDILELKRQLSLADSQLRKSEVSRKRLEICNRKLLLFVQVTCSAASGAGGSAVASYLNRDFASPTNFLVHKQEIYLFLFLLILTRHCLLVRRNRGTSSCMFLYPSAV